MAVQVLAMTSVIPGADDALEKYLETVGPLMASAGAELVSRYRVSDNVAGSDEIQFISLIEYPDEAAVRMVFESEEYKSLEETKKSAFSRYQVSVIVPM